MDIPKLIHQTAPTDITRWQPIWVKCRESWVNIYPHFSYRMWDDEDIDKFVKTRFSKYYPMWKQYPHHIMRVDLVRYMILYEYGGIYVDMDYEVVKDFYNELPKDKVSISESPYKWNEYFQNALMSSPPKHPFWLIVLDEAVKRKHHENVLDATGPRLIDAAVERALQYVHILPYQNYNPSKYNSDFNNIDNLITRHWGTEAWCKN